MDSTRFPTGYPQYWGILFHGVRQQIFILILESLHLRKWKTYGLRKLYVCAKDNNLEFGIQSILYSINNQKDPLTTKNLDRLKGCSTFLQICYTLTRLWFSVNQPLSILRFHSQCCWICLTNWLLPASTATCVEESHYYRCTHTCGLVGDKVGLRLRRIIQLSNISITAYQYLKCPTDSYGPGCELNCDCSERETCHYVKGCHTGKKMLVITSLCYC